MKQLQDVATQGFDAVILSTHDENAAGPLVKQLDNAGIPVVIFNSDIANFPAPISAVVGYAQRKATHALGDYIAKKFNGVANVGVLEGQAGYHSTERIGGFLDAFKPFPDMKIVASLPTTWDADTANKATLDMMQAHPEINLIVAANDFEAIGAAKALKGLNRSDVEVYGNDGDTTGMEQIAAGEWQGTSNTVPFTMGKITMQVTMDVLNGKYPGGYLETPAIQTYTADVARFLCHPETLSPAPAKTYTCPEAGATGAGAYALPEGALVQPVPLADSAAQFTGTIAYKPGNKARIAYMPPVINPYYGAIEAGAKAQAEALGVEMVTFSPSGHSDIAGQMKQLQDVATRASTP